MLINSRREALSGYTYISLAINLINCLIKHSLAHGVMILKSPLAAAEVAPIDVMAQVAVPRSDTLDSHVAVKKEFCWVIMIAVETLVSPTGYTIVSVPLAGTVIFPLASRNSATNCAVLPDLTLVVIMAP